MSQPSSPLPKVQSAVWKLVGSPIKLVFGSIPDPRARLLLAIGTAAMVWYYASITCIGFNWVAKPKAALSGAAASPIIGSTSPKDAEPGSVMELHQFMSFSITTISGTMATYLGMVLGFGQKPTGPPAQGAAKTSEITRPQKSAAWAYFISLLYALTIWAYHELIQNEPKEPNTSIVIVTLGQSILGLFGGALAVILNVDGKN